MSSPRFRPHVRLSSSWPTTRLQPAPMYAQADHLERQLRREWNAPRAQRTRERDGRMAA